MKHHREEDAFMVPGMGAQPVPVKEWVPANDNVESGWPMQDVPHAGWVDRGMPKLWGNEKKRNNALDQPPADFQPVDKVDGKAIYDELIAGTVSAISKYKGEPVNEETVRRMSEDVSAFMDAVSDEKIKAAKDYVDLAAETFAPLDQLPAAEQPATRIGPYIATATGGTFFPLDPRPSEVDIRHIARSHSMQCRYNGAVRRFYSVAEHVTLIARSLVKEHGKRVALAGLLHDAPEAYTGFGDVVSPMKSEFPFVGEMEDNIWRKAIAPHFGLSPAIPHVVHEADMRIRGNEVANLAPMAWHEEYDNPLPVPMMYWSPAEAEREFLATYTALTGEVV